MCVILLCMQGCVCYRCFFFQAEDGIRDLVRSRGLGDVYKRQLKNYITYEAYFRIAQATEEDVHVERKKAARALARLSLIHI